MTKQRWPTVIRYIFNTSFTNQWYPSFVVAVKLYTHSLTYPSLCPWGLLGPARRSRHPSWSDADATAASHVCQSSFLFHGSSPCLSRSTLPPLTFRCPCQCSQDLHALTIAIFSLMRTDTSVLPVASYSSSLLRWLGQNLLSILLKHVQWNTSSLLRSVAVTLHILAPHNSTDRKFEFRMPTWSSGWICLTSRCCEVCWRQFLLVLVASWCLLLRHQVCQVLNLGTWSIPHLPPPLLLSWCSLCIYGSS